MRKLAALKLVNFNCHGLKNKKQLTAKILSRFRHLRQWRNGSSSHTSSEANSSPKHISSARNGSPNHTRASSLCRRRMNPRASHYGHASGRSLPQKPAAIAPARRLSWSSPACRSRNPAVRRFPPAESGPAHLPAAETAKVWAHLRPHAAARAGPGRSCLGSPPNRRDPSPQMAARSGGRSSAAAQRADGCGGVGWGGGEERRRGVGRQREAAAASGAGDGVVGSREERRRGGGEKNRGCSSARTWARGSLGIRVSLR